MGYSHIQTGRLLGPFALFEVVVGGLALPAAFADEPSAAWLILAAMVLLLAVVAAFSQLTVVVDEAGIVASFGLGWPQKRIVFADVVAASQVRNHWWYGFGIRWVPGGWLWNVWGLDAVEFVTASGRIVRIGTDEPEQLLAAVPVHLRR